VANRYLLPLYKELYGKDFSYSNFDERMEMQKGIYLLQDMGVPIGDYGFRWYLHGPYSQRLQDDMYYEDGKPTEQLVLAEENARSVKRLSEVIHSPKRGQQYPISHWVECLASLQYLRKNIMKSNAGRGEVVSELEKRKEHLNNRAANEAAYDLLEGLFA